MSLWCAAAWKRLAHPVVSANSMANTRVVEHSLECSAALWGQATLVQLALAITNPFVLLFALFRVSYGSMLIKILIYQDGMGVLTITCQISSSCGFIRL